MLNFDSIKADKWLSCFLAVDAAKSCIHVWSENHPKDERPNKAIEAAEAWLNNPCKETSDAAHSADDATVTSSDIYAGYVEHIAYAAVSAVSAASAHPPYCTNASYYASKALNQNTKEYINNLLHKHLSFIVDYKIKCNQSFGDFEAVFEAASEADKEKLLFHMGLNNANT